MSCLSHNTADNLLRYSLFDCWTGFLAFVSLHLIRIAWHRLELSLVVSCGRRIAGLFTIAVWLVKCTISLCNESLRVFSMYSRINYACVRMCLLVFATASSFGGRQWLRWLYRPLAVNQFSCLVII